MTRGTRRTYTAQTKLDAVDNRHALAQLANRIDWQACQAKFGGLYASGVGRPGHPIRLMVGLQLLKQICNVSDEELVRVWAVNPYWQYLRGEQYFRHDLPIDPSLMTMFRKRIGTLGCEFIRLLEITRSRLNASPRARRTRSTNLA